MKTILLCLMLFSALTLNGCTKTNQRPEPETTAPAVTEVPVDTHETAPADTPAGEDGFDAVIHQYQTALSGNADAQQMMELGLNYMIPECLAQDERARVGYFLGDMNGDGEKELAIAASSESEYYTGLIFAMYVLEDGSPRLLVESGERNRWYYAGEGKLLNIASSSASESGWYLCTADGELAYLDAVEYNGAQYPDDPWLSFAGETWEHIKEEDANQKIMDFGSMVSNLDIVELAKAF